MKNPMTRHQLLEDLSDAEINTNDAMAEKVASLEERVEELEKMLKQLSDRLDESQEIAQIRSTNYNPNLDDN